MQTTEQTTQGAPSTVVVKALTKPVTAVVHIDREAAIRAGKSNWGDVIVAVDVASLTEAQRELLAKCNTVAVAGEAHASLKSYPLSGHRVSTPAIAEIDSGTVARILDSWIAERERAEEEAAAARARAIADLADRFAAISVDELVCPRLRHDRAAPDIGRAVAKRLIGDKAFDLFAHYELQIGKSMAYDDALVSALAADPRVVAKIEAGIEVIRQRRTERVERQAAEQRAKEEAEAAQEAERQAQDRQVAEFIAQHGTANQQARLKADVLPREEAVAALRDHAFAPLAGLARFKKITRSDIEAATDTDDFGYDEDEALQFAVEPLAEMDADTWGRFEAVSRAAAEAFGDAAKVEARLHRGGFEQHGDWAVEVPSALVTATVGAFTFSREFAL